MSGIKLTIHVPFYFIVSVWVGIGKLHLMNKCACIIHSLDTLLHAVSKWQTGESVKLTTCNVKAEECNEKWGCFHKV